MGGCEQTSPLRILTGQTASGKSSVAVSLAEAVRAEVISVDSMKVYRGLDIGTAKPSREVRDRVPFHLVDVVEPGDVYSLARYLRDAHAALAAIAARGRHAIFVGGAPLYLRGLLYGIFDGPEADWPLRRELVARVAREGPDRLHEELRAVDPETAQRVHPHDVTRVVRALEVVRVTGRPLSRHQRQYPAKTPAVHCRLAALRRSEEDLRQRIARRTEQMFAGGLVAEARAALENGGLNRSLEKAIGYREALAYVRGELSLAEAVEGVKRNTWRLARKQRTWLKSFPDVRWVDVPPGECAGKTADRVRGVLFGGEALN